MLIHEINKKSKRNEHSIIVDLQCLVC